MSTSQPPNSAERVLARHGRGPSPVLQSTVVLLGAVASAVISGVLSTVSESSNPIWVLPVVVSGIVLFVGLLATTAWAARSALALGGEPVVGGARYLVVVLLVAAAVVLSRGEGGVVDGVGVGLVAGAVVLALLSLQRSTRRRALERRSSRLREGRHTSGEVTDDGLAEFPDSPNPKLATVTVRFRDLQGTDRWVTRSATQVPGRVIAVGTAVDVWFDPADPSEVRSILVEHDNGVSRIIA